MQVRGILREGVERTGEFPRAPLLGCGRQRELDDKGRVRMSGAREHWGTGVFAEIF